MADEDKHDDAPVAEDHAAKLADLNEQIAKLNEEGVKLNQRRVRLEAEREHAQAERQMAALKADHDAAKDSSQLQKALQTQIDQHQSIVDVAKAKVDHLNDADDVQARDRAAGVPQPEEQKS